MATRNSRGQMERDLEQAQIDTEAAELRRDKLTFPQIAARQGCSVSTAYERVKRAINAVPFEAVEDLRRVELDSLDMLERAALKVLRAEHVKIDHGRVIEIDGVRVLDDAPVLQAITSILRIKERRARLTGIEVPIQVTQEVKHSVQSDLDREIEHLLERMGRVGEIPSPMAPESAGHPAHP